MNSHQTKTEQTKQKILQAVYKIVKEEGVQMLSSTKIIKKAEISKGRFFHHFSQIDDLYLYILDCFVEKLEVNLAPIKFKDFEEFLHQATEYSFFLLDQSSEEIIMIFYFLGYSQHNFKYRSKFKMILNSSFKKWANDISQYFKSDLSEKQKEYMVRLLDMYFCGLSFHYLVLGEKKLYKEITNDFIEMFISFIKKEGLV